MIYLDYNATTPVDPRVLDEMLPFFSAHYGNPSSIHLPGKTARAALEKSRRQVADLIGAEPDEIIFTSGGTESNNLAILGSVASSPPGHIVTCVVEHPAVAEPVRFLEGRGCRVTRVPVDGYGRVSSADVLEALRPDTFLVTLMHSNNEVGTLQPVAELGPALVERGIRFHSDAAQSPGKVRIDVRELGVDLLSLAGHKFYGPKGVGALYVRRGTGLSRVLLGASQEKGLRPGTEAVPLIVGLGSASELAATPGWGGAMKAMTERLADRLRRSFPELRLNGHSSERLPNTLNVCLPGMRVQQVLESLGDRLAVSTASACHSGAQHPSSVLKAMGLSDEDAFSSIRFSAGKDTSEEEIEVAVALLEAEFERVLGGG